MKKNCLAMLLLVIAYSAFAQGKYEGKFEQLGTDLPTPNEYRTASGAPGHAYWQQKVDYQIAVTLDDKKQRITGTEKITYHNQSPNPLSYLWVQLDQNMRAPNSNTPLVESTQMKDSLPAKLFDNSVMTDSHSTTNIEGGFHIEAVQDQNGKPLKYLINQTMMKVNLPQPLQPGENYTFGIEWNYNINDRMMDGGRSG
jgi:hypothetical protein